MIQMGVPFTRLGNRSIHVTHFDQKKASYPDRTLEILGKRKCYLSEWSKNPGFLEIPLSPLI